MGILGTDLPVLVCQAGPLNGDRHTIDKEIIIGRDPECGLVIPDRQVSRFHARLTQTEEGVLLEDLGSKNGTFYEGKRIEEPVFLQDGSLLQIALVQNIVFLSSDATIPLLGGISMSGAESSTGKLFLDGRSRRVWIGKEEVLPPLSVSQFRLIQVLYEQEGNVVPREELIHAIWGSEESFGVSEEAVDALVRRLRDRLASYDPGHAYIITIRGHGLRFENNK